MKPQKFMMKYMPFRPFVQQTPQPIIQIHTFPSFGAIKASRPILQIKQLTQVSLPYKINVLHEYKRMVTVIYLQVRGKYLYIYMTSRMYTGHKFIFIKV